jgi:hypothetical protein
MHRKMKGVATFTKAVDRVRADYPREPLGAHVALVALCFKRPAEPHRR